ncbi:MAG: tetratricopeptide repeat protein [Bacteroidota bacterium]|nr:tetratricopeptide repeat protein [Bacteroidota bacterium]MDW8272037.1 tetratricopeptide repeat protein [Bacteroidota bacterium]
MTEVTTPTSEQVVESKPETAITLPPWFERLWSDRRVRLGTIGIGIVLVGIALFAWWRSIQQEQEQEASLALSRVLPYIEAQQYDAALNGDPKKTVRGEPIQGLLAIADTYGGTAAGKAAALYAGHIYLERQRYDEAERYFEQAEASSSTVVRIGALAGLAVCKEQRKQFQEAAQLYERLTAETESTGMKDKYTLFAAQCYEKAGDTEQAIRLYKALLAEFEFSEYAADAKAGLVRLGMVIDY